MEAERVWECVEGADALVLGSPLGRGVVVDSVVLDAVELWLSPAERLGPSWLSVRFPRTVVLFIDARVFTEGPAVPVGKPLWFKKKSKKKITKTHISLGISLVFDCCHQ